MQQTRHKCESELKESFENQRTSFINDPRKLFIERCPALTSAVIVKRNAMISTGGFSLALKTSEDVHAWITLAGLKGGFAFDPKPTMLYRRGRETVSISRKSERWQDLAVQYNRLMNIKSYKGLSFELNQTAFDTHLLYLSQSRTENRFQDAFRSIKKLTCQFGMARQILTELLKILLRYRWLHENLNKSVI